MKTQSHFNSRIYLPLITCLVLGLSLNAQATSETWTGGGSGSWSDATNWGGSSFPNAIADVATFSATPATITTLGGNINLLNLVQGAATVSVGDTTGNTLTFNTATNGTAIAGAANQSMTLNVNTTFKNNNAITASGATGTLTFGSSTTPTSTTFNTGGKIMTFSGSGATVNLYSSVSGGGTLQDQNLILNLGNSTNNAAILMGKSGTNTSTANVMIITNGISIGSGLSIATGAGSTSQNSFVIGSNISGGGSATYTGTFNMSPGTGQNATVSLTAAASNTITFSNTLSGSSTGSLLFKTAGPGTVVLSGANNTYIAPTTILSGTLEFAKAGSMSANSAVTVNTGATIAVGVGGAGQFTTTGTGSGTLAGILSGTGGQGNTVTYQNGTFVGIDTGSNSVSYGNAITNAGPNSIGITKLGTGALTLTAASTYSGATTVAAGTLVLGNGSGTVSTTALTNGNGSATGTGPLVVSPGATLAGAGTAAVSSFSISGTSSSNKALVLVGQTSTSDTNTSGALTLLGGTLPGNSTIANANLTFNLDQSHVGVGNTLNVGATGITFGASVTLALNMQNAGVIPVNSSYVLIAGTGVTTISGGLTSGQYAGLQTFVNAQGLTEIVNSGNGQAGNLTLALSGLGSTWYGNGSYLYLSQNALTGVDDIDVEVVPEPGTWAMMLGGLAVLFFWQRRKTARA